VFARFNQRNRGRSVRARSGRPRIQTGPGCSAMARVSADRPANDRFPDNASVRERRVHMQEYQ
jgi:hypothetical protein